MDDASDDNSAEVISEELRRIADDRFRLISLTENVGRMGAIDEGMRNASGAFVGPLDADDLWAPDFLRAHILSHLNSSRVSGFSFYDAIVLARLTNEVQPRYVRELRWARITNTSILMIG